MKDNNDVSVFYIYISITKLKSVQNLFILWCTKLMMYPLLKLGYYIFRI